MHISPSKSPATPRLLGEPNESELQLVKGLFGSDQRRGEALEAIYREPDRAGPHTAYCLAILIRGSSLDVSERRLAVQSLARIAAGGTELAALLDFPEVVTLDSNAFAVAFLKQIQRGDDAGWAALERLLCMPEVTEHQTEKIIGVLVQNSALSDGPTPGLVPLLDSVVAQRGDAIIGPALKAQLIRLIDLRGGDEIAAFLLSTSSSPNLLAQELLSSATGLAWARTMRLLARQAPLQDHRRIATKRYLDGCDRERIENVESFVDDILAAEPTLLGRSECQRIFRRYWSSERISDRQYDQLKGMVTAGLLEPMDVMAALHQGEATDGGRRLVELCLGCREGSLKQAAQMLYLYFYAFAVPVLSELLSPEAARGLPAEIQASLIRILGLRTERTPDQVKRLRAIVAPHKLSSDPQIRSAVKRTESLVSWNPFRRKIAEYLSSREARGIFEMILDDGVREIQKNSQDIRAFTRQLRSKH